MQQRNDGVGSEPSMQARRRAMTAFALADPASLAAFWRERCDGTGAEPLRGPEVGLVMLRGRIGGGGRPFNVGEASVARASVRLASGAIGHAMVLGRDTEHARLAALLDAAWQEPARRAMIEDELVTPLLAADAEASERRAEETAATRVDFFTVARGED